MMLKDIDIHTNGAGSKVIVEDKSKWDTGYVSVDTDEVPILIERLRKVTERDIVAELRRELNAR
jgi:hypothetical protein